MNGIQNFLYFMNENWTSILVCIGLVIALSKKVYDYIALSTDEKISVAKTQLEQIVLKMITEAEIDYDEWNKAGSIKRSQVIENIFMKYPVLSKAVDQQEIIDWIDEQINTSLKTLREVIKENSEA